MRMLPALLGVGLLFPGGAGAATQGGPDLAGSVIQMFGSLILVVGIILIIYYLASRFMKLPQAGGRSYIRVVETRHLGPKRSLVLVEVGGEYLLLSSGAEGIGFIKQVEMLEEIEVLDEHGYATMIPVQLRQKLRSFAGENRAGGERLAGLKKSGGLRETK